MAYILLICPLRVNLLYERVIMVNSIYIGLSRQKSLRQAIDVVANNIANANTTAFKADKTRFIEYVEHTQRGENLSFVRNHSAFRDNKAGHLERTGNTLDVALSDKGFFVVDTPAGERYTRDGRFRINADGDLTTSEGFVIRGDGGPITIPENATDIAIDKSGFVSFSNADNERIDAGQILTVEFDEPRDLQKQGASLYRTGNQVPIIIEEPNMRQGYIEKSNVNAVQELSSLIALQRSHDSVARVLREEDNREEQMIRRLTTNQ